MPGRATIASSVSGLIAGVAATFMVTGERPHHEAGDTVVMMAAWLAAMVCVTIIALATLRRWLNTHEARTRQMAQQVAIERSTFIEASATRARELKEREDRLNQQAEQASSYVMGIARRLDEALTRNSHLEEHLAALQGAYAELAEDHNRLVRETLQERADRFSRPRPAITPAARSTAPASPPAAAPQVDNPGRPYLDERARTPAAPIPLRRIPSAARLADSPQHDRTVEGVSGQA